MFTNLFEEAKKKYEKEQDFEAARIEETKLGPYSKMKFVIYTKDSKTMVLFSVKHTNYQFPVELQDNNGDYEIDNEMDLEEKMEEIITHRIELLQKYHNGKTANKSEKE